MVLELIKKDIDYTKSKTSSLIKNLFFSYELILALKKVLNLTYNIKLTAGRKIVFY